MDISTFQRWRAAERGEVLIFWALVVQAQFHQHASIPPWNPTRTDQVQTKYRPIKVQATKRCCCGIRKHLRCGLINTCLLGMTW